MLAEAESMSPIVLLLERAPEAFLINGNKKIYRFPPSSKERNTNIIVSDSRVFLETCF